jgi:hypothetical protein
MVDVNAQNNVSIAFTFDAHTVGGYSRQITAPFSSAIVAFASPFV